MKKYIIIAIICCLTSSLSAQNLSESVFDNSPEIDVAKALYGKIAGLNVYQGSGSSAANTPTLSIHGKTPLIIVDGFPRDLSHITPSEIESIQVLKDAVGTALYGVRGANGVVLITTKHGNEDKLKVTAKYQFGMGAQYRKPLFADSYRYANALNTALASDNLAPKYNASEIEAFRSNSNPYEYPNVKWWDEVYNDNSYNHRLNFTFSGGSPRFRYYSVVDYMNDVSMFKSKQPDTRYSTLPSDVRLNIRANVDVDITSTTLFKVGILGRLQEYNNGYYTGNNSTNSLSSILYGTPSAAFPVRYDNGIYGGNSIYGANNPVALLESTGNLRTTYSTLLANATLIQKLDMLLKGLSIELSTAFDNCGSMYDSARKEYRYMDARPTILEDGTIVTNPIIYGKDSEVLNHGNAYLKSLYVRSNVQGKINYLLKTDRHDFNAALLYDQQSHNTTGRNKSSKRQSVILQGGYTYDGRYSLNAVASYSGTAYLPKGSRFHLYPAVSAAWTLSNEKFMKNVKGIDLIKFYASYGIAGWDGNMQHELFLQSYGSTNGGVYYLTNNATDFYGVAEGTLPVENLTIEQSEKINYGIEMALFGNRLTLNAERFFDRRSNMLIDGSTTVSGIIGIPVSQLNAGVAEYRGFDASFSWSDTIGENFRYGFGGTASYINSKIINDGQAYQQYDYLYTKGNRVGQRYGLEVLGFFGSQMEINNSPVQTFSQVRPGDIKYKDQNGDNKIDEQDVVKMFGSNLPRFYFGFNLNAAYRNFEISADFQGLTGVTTSLLNSPLYKPLVNNGNISSTFLDRETPWTMETAKSATMPRLTTLSNANNYRANSLWYRDGSFIKLRNLYISYTFPKKMTRFADLKLYLQGTNLFSLDNIKFTDPEQMGAIYPTTRSYWVGLKFNF